MGDPADLSIAEAGAALRQGALTSVALTQAHLDRIAARDGRVGAFTYVAADAALATAAEADRTLAEGRDLGPLHGIPFAIKDIFDVAGLPVRWGSRLHAARIAERTAPAVQALLDGGAVPLGVVATYELASVGPDETAPAPIPVNPWNPGHVTGGSSSGSAAAVAAGLVRLALGSDTGGSVRSPAAYCGVVGLKPTYGALPCDGMMPLAPSLDHVGVIARTVEDATLGFSALSGQRWETGAITGLRLAYGRGWAIDPRAHPALLPLLDEAASVLSLCGAAISLTDLPPYDPIEAAGADILAAEAFAVHGAAVAANPDAVGEMARDYIRSGRGIDAARLDAARAKIAPLRAALDAVLEADDALILPTTLTPAPALATRAGQKSPWTPMRTIPFNLTGHPALSVPMGFADGLPLGLQIVGRPNDEATILRIAAAFEAATDHAAPQPPFA